MASLGAALSLSSIVWARMIATRNPLPYVVWSGFVARGLFLLMPFIQSAWSFIGILAAGNFLATVAAPAQAALIDRIYPRPQRGRALGTIRVLGGLLAVALTLIAAKVLHAVSYRLVFPLAAVGGMAASLWQRRLPLPGPATEAAAQAPPAPTIGAWRVLRTDAAFRRLLVVSFVFGVGVWIQIPADPIMLADELRATTGQVGVFAAVAAIAAAAGNWYWGRQLDRRPSTQTLMMVYVVGLATPLMYAASWTPWMMIGISVTEALMTTGLDLVFTMALLDAAGRGRAAQYVGISTTLAGIRGMVVPPLSGVLIETAGVRVVYMIAAAAMLLGLVLLHRHLRLSPAPPSLGLRHLPAVGTARSLPGGDAFCPARESSWTRCWKAVRARLAPRAVSAHAPALVESPADGARPRAAPLPLPRRPSPGAARP
jgi:MFS family permease